MGSQNAEDDEAGADAQQCHQRQNADDNHQRVVAALVAEPADGLIRGQMPF
jgi:hypothetical protein